MHTHTSSIRRCVSVDHFQHCKRSGGSSDIFMCQTRGDPKQFTIHAYHSCSDQFALYRNQSTMYIKQDYQGTSPQINQLSNQSMSCSFLLKPQLCPVLRRYSITKTFSGILSQKEQGQLPLPWWFIRILKAWRLWVCCSPKLKTVSHKHPLTHVQFASLNFTQRQGWCIR